MEERMFRCAAFVALAAAASVALWSAPSPAQEPYPSRTVKIVVPAFAGSTTDTLARIVADQLNQKWGKATIVENIPGGAMNIASELSREVEQNEAGRSHDIRLSVAHQRERLVFP